MRLVRSEGDDRKGLAVNERNGSRKTTATAVSAYNDGWLPKTRGFIGCPQFYHPSCSHCSPQPSVRIAWRMVVLSMIRCQGRLVLGWHRSRRSARYARLAYLGPQVQMTQRPSKCGQQHFCLRPAPTNNAWGPACGSIRECIVRTLTAGNGSFYLSVSVRLRVASLILTLSCSGRNSRRLPRYDGELHIPPRKVSTRGWTN